MLPGWDGTPCKDTHSRAGAASPVGHADGEHAAVADDGISVARHLLDERLRRLLAPVLHQRQAHGHACRAGRDIVNT
jgi:hypothetical protein